MSAHTDDPQDTSPAGEDSAFPLLLTPGPLTTSAVRKILSRAGKWAGLAFSVHPHMLRHACGFKLANAGHDTRALQHYLGHKNIQHTVRYTELAADRFNGFWGD